jgi:glycosyltransferase involved in cell wall biosynthesis
VRIGIDASNLAQLNGGMSTYLFYYLKGLVEKKPEWIFFLYSPSGQGEISQFAKYPNVQLRIIPFFSSGLSIWLQTLVAFYCWRDRIDLFWGPLQAIPLFKRKRMKTVLSLHDFTFKLFPETMTWKKSTFLKVFSKKMFSSSDAILPVSQGSGEKLKHFYDLPYHKVLPPPMKPFLKPFSKEDCAQLLAQHGLEYGKYVISVGTWEPRKNYVKLIYMYQHILNEQGRDQVLPLVIIGGGGWKNEDIAECLNTAQQSHPDHIKLLGFVSDDQLPLFLSGAKYYLTVSHYEGYGMPISEARICGTPVVCPDQVEMREAAENDALFFTELTLEPTLRHIFIGKNAGLQPKQGTYPSNEDKISWLIETFQSLTS